MYKIFFLTILSCNFIFTSNFIEFNNKKINYIDSLAYRLIDKKIYSGLSVYINLSDSIVYNKNFGLANIENKTLIDSKNKEILIDNRKYNEFASFFSNLQCGIYRSDLNTEDFILSKKIYITNNNQTDSLIIYDISKIQKTQKEYASTVENLYAKWNNSDMVIIQKNIFNKVLITLDEIKK